MTMQQSSPEEVLSKTLRQITESIEILLEKRHSQSVLILLFTTIDILGSLIRPKSDLDTHSHFFKKWADDYMIAPSHLPFTSEELWGVRCGLLHTHTPSSKLSRTGKIRQIHFFRGSSLQYEQAMRTHESQKNVLYVNIDELYEHFKKGISAFYLQMETDASLRNIALHHAKALIGTHRR